MTDGGAADSLLCVASASAGAILRRRGRCGHARARLGRAGAATTTDTIIFTIIIIIIIISLQ